MSASLQWDLDAFLAGGADAGSRAEQLLADLFEPPPLQRRSSTVKQFDGAPERREVRQAVGFAFDSRQEWRIVVRSRSPLRLRFEPTPKLQAYLDGRHGDSEMERLRAWTVRGLDHLIRSLDEPALRSLIVMFQAVDLDGGQLQAELFKELRAELRHKALHAATQGQAPALKVFFDGDLYAERQPTCRPPRAARRPKKRAPLPASN